MHGVLAAGAVTHDDNGRARFLGDATANVADCMADFLNL